MKLKTLRVKGCPPDQVSSGWRIDLLDAGKSVSRLWIVDKWMRIGRGSIKIGGISTVGTEPAYRGKGLSTLVMKAALKLMKEKGYALSILHGIPDFYHRFGYECCLPEYEFRLPLTKNTRKIISQLENGKIRLRAVSQADHSALVKLANREQKRRTGSLLRDPKRWPGFWRCIGWASKANIRVAEDETKNICGYVVYDRNPKENAVSEIGGNIPEVFAAILKFLAHRNKSTASTWYNMAIPPDHAFSLFCMNLDSEASVNYPDSGEFMGCVLDRQAFIEKLAQAWILPVPILKICRKMKANALLTLALGYQTPASLALQKKIKLTPSQLKELSLAFPPQFAHMSWADRF